MAPKKSSKSASAPRSDSPYTLSNIIADGVVTDLAKSLRSSRPCLRTRSTLLEKLPFIYTAIYEADSLYEWLSAQIAPSSESEDSLFEIAKWLDWYERHGIYQDASTGKDRRSNKELRCAIRRYGLEEGVMTPAPDQFLAINNRGTLVWTDTHQWLILLRFFDVLADLRDIPHPTVDRVAPSPTHLLALTGSLTSPWLSMRLDWQLSVKNAISSVKAAHGLSDEDFANERVIERADEQEAETQVVPLFAGSAETLTAPPFARSAPSTRASAAPVSAERVTAIALMSRQSDVVSRVFAKFDQMSLTAAVKTIIPSVKSADEQTQYLAICVNIQLAALSVNFIQTNARGTENFSLKEIVNIVPADQKADWMSTRHILQPLMLMLHYSPLFVLARTRLYSAPLPSFAVAFEIMKAMGNSAKPRALVVLERSIWGLVFQVAQGASVYDVLPVYMSGWLADIDSDAVTECKSWLDDFGSNPALGEEAAIQDWDESDLLQMGREYATQRDETREPKPEPVVNKNGKRPAPPTAPAPAPKRPANAAGAGTSSASLAPSGKGKNPAAPVASSSKKKDSLARPASSAAGKRPAKKTVQPRARSASSSSSSSSSTSPPPRGVESGQAVGRVLAEKARADDGESEVQEGGDDSDVIFGRLTPEPDTEEEEEPDEEIAGEVQPTASAEGDGLTAPMDVDGPESALASGDHHGSPSRQPSFKPRGLRAAEKVKEGGDKASDAVEAQVQKENFVSHPVSVPAWSAEGMKMYDWTPSRKDVSDMFTLLSSRAITSYQPGSEDSAIAVLSVDQFSAMSMRDVQDLFSKKSILVRGGNVDPFWTWGLGALSALRPIHRTKVQVQDAVKSFKGDTFDKTIATTIPELVSAGLPGSGKVVNCLDLPLGERRLRNIPHISSNETFNILPFLFNVASLDRTFDSVESSSKFHWALAGVSGAETAQHIDSGGYATVIEVLSGQKLWAVGVRKDGNSFSNDSSCLSRPLSTSDWESISRDEICWESLLLDAGDAFLMRPGPHMVYTPTSSICYGEYFITPGTLVDHATSFALTCLGNKIVTNDRIPESLHMYLALGAWWWNGDLACDGDVHDPSARASRVSLSEYPRVYVALLALNVFQTSLQVKSYDDRDWEALGVNMDHVAGRLFRKEAARIHEWIGRQGVLARKGTDLADVVNDKDRAQYLQDVVLDFGRGMFKMGVIHARTNTHFSTQSLRQRLINDARAAYGVSVKQWLNETDFTPAPLIPDVDFHSAPRPSYTYSFQR